MIRALTIVGIALAVLLAVAAAAVAWLVGTERGSRFALEQAQGFLPAGIDLGSANGRLADDLALENVTVALEGLELTIARLELRWSPGELLKGRLEISEIGAEGVRYRALPSDRPDPPDEPFLLPERLELPVSVHVERLTVDDIEIRTGPEAAPLEVTRVLLTGAAFVDSGFTLEALQVDAALGSVRGRADATAAGEYPLDVHLEWRFRPAGYAPIHGTTVLGGSLAALTLDQHLAGPYNTALAGTVSHLVDPDRTIEVALRLAAADVRLTAVQDELPDAAFSVGAEVTGPVDALDVQVDARGTDPEGNRLLATAHALVEPESVTVRQLVVRQTEHDGVLHGDGRITLAGEVAADLSIRWEALQWPLTGEPTVASPRGTLEVDGPLEAYRLDLDARLEPAGSPPVDLRVDGNGDLASASLSLGARTGDGTLEGTIDATWDPAVAGEASLRMAGFDPSAFAPDWPGSVNLAVAASARIEGDGVHVSIDRLDANGTLRDQDLSVAAGGRYAQEGGRHTVDLDRLDASLGATRLEARGRVDDRADLEWRLASDDLASLAPGAAGKISGSGRLSGPLPRVRVEASLEARDLAYADNRLEALDLRADVDLSGDTASRLTLAARDGSVAGTGVSRLAVEGSGTPESHELRLNLNADPGRGSAALDGRLEDTWGRNPVWRFTLAEGELAYGELAPWRLTQAASGAVGGERMHLEPLCWEAADARVCLDGRRDGRGLAANLEVADLRFAYFAALLPDDMQLTGAVNASARVQQPTGGPLTARAAIDTTAGELELAVSGGDAGAPAVIRLQPSSVSLEVDPSQARARAAIDLDVGRLRVDAATRAASGEGAEGEQALTDQALSGSVELDVPDLAFVADLVPAVEDVQGNLRGALEMSGTLGEPALTGSLDLRGGSLFVPEPGLTLTELGASLQGLGREGIALAASASSGGGTLRLDGRMTLPGATPAGRLAVEGDAFQVMNNDEAVVFLSPDLQVAADGERLTISGAVHVPRAEITPGAQAPSAATVSPDQVLVTDEPEAQAEAGRELSAEVRLTLGDEVHFQGFGLTARFEGNVLVNQEPRTPTTATGELSIVDGEYRAYGQGLVIDSGRIYFAGGPVTQPALDIRAVRRPREGILVGAHVQGTLESPSFELFSEPTMTQQEQLSYLVLGRSLEEAPDGQGSALSRAALAMGVKGGDFLARNIGEQVGIDDIGIETGSGEAGAPSDPAEAALVIGKYLSPKLYVSYGIGLFNPQSVLELQYEISKRWTLVTQSGGDATGADVLYTVERGAKRTETP